jgi:TrmH family RNA methyltransferase
VKSITSRQNPLVKRYRDAAGGGRSEIILDGAHLIEEATAAGVALHTIACSPPGLELPGVRQLIGRFDAAGLDCWSVTDDIMRAISPVKTPSGVVALAGRPTLTLEQALDVRPPLVIVAVDVQDPGNVGAIVRAAEAGGATAAVLAGTSADPFGWKALRGSMGSCFRLPVVRAGQPEMLAALRARGVRVIATAPRGSRSLFESDLRGPAALLVGAEGTGLADDLLAGADETVSIPMREPVESLNVAVAAALLVYEASRQRGRATGRPGW